MWVEETATYRKARGEGVLGAGEDGEGRPQGPEAAIRMIFSCFEWLPRSTEVRKPGHGEHEKPRQELQSIFNLFFK